jgi:spore maturation protein CgeB
MAQRERPDIVIVLKGLALGPGDVNALRATGAWVVNINHDDFFSANRNNWSPLQRRAIPHYDFVFTTREVNVGEIRPLNPNVEFLGFAYYPRIHRPVSIGEHERDLWAVDVVFVGTWERERWRMLEHLVREVPARYAIWGNQWERVGPTSLLRPYLRCKEVVMDDMAKALGSAKLALGFLRKDNRDDYTQRTFEIPACGGVFVGERTARHAAYYREGTEATFFDPSKPGSLAQIVRGLLGDDAKRESLRRAGRDALLRQKHTYADRLARLLELHGQARQQVAGSQRIL